MNLKLGKEVNKFTLECSANANSNACHFLYTLNQPLVGNILKPLFLQNHEWLFKGRPKQKSFLYEVNHLLLLVNFSINSLRTPLYCIRYVKYPTLPRLLNEAWQEITFQIVANERTGIDVDKFDYLLRDCYYLGVNCTLDWRYSFNNLFICQKQK